MYDHVGLKVKDLEASIKFYTAALERDEEKWEPVFRSSSRSKCKN